MSPGDAPDDSGTAGWWRLLAGALVAGLLAGALGGSFRLVLRAADAARTALLVAAHGRGIAGAAAVVALAAIATGLAVWMVRRFEPAGAGSGIPNVEAALRGDHPPARARVIPVKFVGGTLAIGAGLALGREGPTVQMGATVGHLVGRLLRLPLPDARTLLAAGGAAGLATAFNAPLAGLAFVIEELRHRVDAPTVVTTLGTSVAAIAVSRLLLGSAPDFSVLPLAPLGLRSIPVLLVLGVVAGVLGVAHNRLLLATMRAFDRTRDWAAGTPGLAVGAAVGVLAWFAPDLVGGGDVLAQRMIDGKAVLELLPVFFLARLLLGAISYACGPPGGLFAPMLALGAQLGLFVGLAGARWLPALVTEPPAYAIVGMTALFTAIVRAPLTGIVLLIEMTGSLTLVLPMVAVAFAAHATATLLGDEPIYEALGRR